MQWCVRDEKPCHENAGGSSSTEEVFRMEGQKPLETTLSEADYSRLIVTAASACAMSAQRDQMHSEANCVSRPLDIPNRIGAAVGRPGQEAR